MRLVTAALVVAVLATVATAQDLKVEERKLDNGMTVLIVERHNAPIVSFNLKFRVGSADEEVGRTGLAHILEHMLFKGTPYVGTKDYALEKPLLEKIEKLYLTFRSKKWALPASLRNDTDRYESVLDLVETLARPAKPMSVDEYVDSAMTGKLPREQIAKLVGEKLVPAIEEIIAIRKEFYAVQAEAEKLVIPEEDWKILQQNGARGLNASTGNDSTQYFYSLPSNRIELWAMIESNRLRHPVLRQFYKEKEAIKEERRLRIDSSPMGRMWERFNATAFSASPYRWPVIGWLSDIEEVSRTEVEEFFRRNYAPNRAVATIVGDVKPDEGMARMERYFGVIPAQPEPRPVVTVEPDQMGERRVKLVLETNPSPAIMMGYHRPALGHPDFYVLDVITGLLQTGRTSRLTQNIYFKKRLGQVQAGNRDSRLPGLFLFSGQPLPGHTLAELEAAIEEELEMLKKEPVSDGELLKIKNQNQASFVRGLRENAQMAQVLGTYEVLYGWEYVETYLDRLSAVTADDVMRVANKYFRKDNRTVITLEPAEVK